MTELSPELADLLDRAAGKLVEQSALIERLQAERDEAETIICEHIARWGKAERRVRALEAALRENRRIAEVMIGNGPGE